MSAFAAQLETEIPALRRYARALTRDLVQTDDLVQSCLVQALSNEHRWQPVGEMRAWLFTILHNLHVSEQRRAVRDRHRRVLVTSSTADSVQSRRDVDLDRAIGRLPDAQRHVLLLIGLDEMSYAEAAATLGLPIGTVRSRLGRARASQRQP